MPAAIDSTTGSGMPRRAAHSACAASRICCGFTASTTSAAPATRLARALGVKRDAGKARGQPSRAASASGSTTRKSRRRAPAREHPADERGRHVAAADEVDAHVSHAGASHRYAARRKSPCRRAPASRLRRSPRRGPPTFPSTACRPAGPPRGTLREHSRRTPELRALRAQIVGRLRDAHDPAQAQRGSAATASRERHARRPARRRSSTPRRSMLTCTQTLSGGASARTRRARAARAIFSRSSVSTHAKRCAANARLVALQRPDQMPFEAGKVGERVGSSRAPPARSSRRMRAGRARGPRARPPARTSC